MHVRPKAVSRPQQRGGRRGGVHLQTYGGKIDHQRQERVNQRAEGAHHHRDNKPAQKHGLPADAVL